MPAIVYLVATGVFILATEFITDTLTLGNILTIATIIVAAWRINNSFVKKFALLELKINTLWKIFLTGKHKDLEIFEPNEEE